tara:strand:- start:334 stop:1341 length:1008 start_codon:yes stop_codon:yes gene_type:complete
MGAIALRSPYYRSDTAGTGANSAKLTLTIEGNLEYTLVKPTTASATMLWEISELCRDFLQLSFDGTTSGETISIISVLTSHASTNGTGTALTTDSDTDVGYDAYGLFSQGGNPFNTPTGSIPTWLINPDPEGTLNNKFYIYVPTGETGYVPYITTSYQQGYSSFNSTATEISGTSAGTKMNIIRVDCTKYGIGHKVSFVNKYGAVQELWFFLKTVNSINKKQEMFQRNTIRTTGVIAGTYSQAKHTKQDYDTLARENITLSSGYYPEWANQWFEQLLLSEQVWITRKKETNPSQLEVLPVNVKTSNFLKKTSLNDKLIDYTFDFELSADYINNIR